MDDFFKDIKTIAVVGLSDKPERASHEVAAYLQTQGFRIIPINPMIKEVLGERSYPSISSIPADIKIDVVDLFRKSEEVMQPIQEAVARNDAKIIWMQEGVENPEAEKYAKDHGLKVVSNFCIMKAHRGGGKINN